ncbi:MAG: 3-coathanger stack domain-containing protein [Bacteroidota bacterium]
MRKHFFITLFLLSIVLANNSIAQVPNNIIPNSNFNHANREPFVLPACNTLLKNKNDYTLVIENWKGEGERNTPEWRSFIADNNNSFCSVCSPLNPTGQNPFIDDNFIFIAQDELVPYGEWLYAELYTSLNYDKKYKLRVIGQGHLPALPSLHDPGVIAIHLTLPGSNWHHQSELDKSMMSMMYCTHQEYECKPRSFEHIFTVTKPNLKQIVLQANNAGFFIDRVELYEYCTELLTRQGRTYKFDRELEEAGTIIAGSVINNAPAMGDVVMLDGSITTYKAANEVKLTEGFYVNRGADFSAKIAPCGQDCPSTNINIPSDYVLCNSDCINLTTGTVTRGLTVNWTSQDAQNLQYLSSVSVINPVFCPPPGTSGVYEYDVVIQNGCGETTTKKVTIKYFSTPVPDPTINITNSNLATLPTYPEISVASTEFTEYVNYDILDCNGNLIHTQTFTFFNQQMPPAPAQFKFNQFLDPCGCYKIRIRQKNHCNETIAEQILDWNRQQSISNLFFPTFIICKDGKRLICFDGKGIKQFQLQLFNKWGQSVLNTSGSYNKDPYCIEFPSHLPAGPYYYIITFIGCDGSVLTANGSMQVGGCDESMLLINNNDTDSIEAFNNLADSIFMELSPNPTANEVTISFTIPNSGQVRINLLDKNLSQNQVVHDMYYSNSGSYQISVQVNHLSGGINYCLFEFINGGTVKVYKKFTLIR